MNNEKKEQKPKIKWLIQAMSSKFRIEFNRLRDSSAFNSEPVSKMNPQGRLEMYQEATEKEIRQIVSDENYRDQIDYLLYQETKSNNVWPLTRKEVLDILKESISVFSSSRKMKSRTEKRELNKFAENIAKGTNLVLSDPGVSLPFPAYKLQCDYSDKEEDPKNYNQLKAKDRLVFRALSYYGFKKEIIGRTIFVSK